MSLNYIVYEYFISFVIAFIVSFAATPIAKKVSFKVGAVDVPKDSRRMHKKPIARMGGLAIISGFLISIFFSVVTAVFDGFGVLNIDEKFISLLIGAFIIFVVAYIDDIHPLGAKLKLLVQLIAAFVVVIYGTRIGFVTDPFFSETGISEIPTYLSIILSVLWIVGITNAINLIDGLDGLAAGVASISSLSLFFVAAIVERSDTALLAAALAGAALGFLPYNFNPAKIFMGDTGSTFLGFVLAVISIQGAVKSAAAFAIAVPLLVLGLPLFDTLSTIFRRIITGKSIMKADRGHLHHKLIDMGLSHKQSVVVMYTASSALGLCAVVLADRGAVSALILIISMTVFIIGGAKYMTEFKDSDDESSEECENVITPESNSDKLK